MCWPTRSRKRRAVQGPKVWLSSTEILNIPFAAVNTTVLVLSSVTCQFGVFAAERYQARRTGSLFNIKSWGMREWFALTFLMGAFFIAGQIFEYASLVTGDSTTWLVVAGLNHLRRRTVRLAKKVLLQLAG